MKKLLFILSLGLFIVSCNNTANNEETDKWKDYYNLDLIVFDDSLKMYIPNTLQGLTTNDENENGEVEVTIGKNFQLKVSQEDGDIALVKSDIAGDNVFKLQQYIVDEPNLIFWETKAPDMSNSIFHFYAVININGLDYVVSDIRNGAQLNKAAVEAMVNAAKTLQAKNPTAPSA